MAQGDIYINFFKNNYKGSTEIDADAAMSRSTDRNIEQGREQAKKIQKALNEQYRARARSLLLNSGKNITEMIANQLSQYTFGFLQAIFKQGKHNTGQNTGFQVLARSKSAVTSLKAIYEAWGGNFDDFKDALSREFTEREAGKTKEQAKLLANFQSSTARTLLLELKSRFQEAEKEGQDAKTALWNHFQEAMKWIKSISTAQGDLGQRIVQGLATKTLTENAEYIFKKTSGDIKAQQKVSGPVGILINSEPVYKKILTQSKELKKLMTDKTTQRTFTFRTQDIEGKLQMTGSEGYQKADIVFDNQWKIDLGLKEGRKYNLSIKNYVYKQHYDFKASNLIFAINLLSMQELNTIGNVFSHSMIKGQPQVIDNRGEALNSIASSLILLSLYQGVSGASQQATTPNASAQFFVVNGPTKKVTGNGQKIDCPQVLVYYIPDLVTMVTKKGAVEDNMARKKKDGPLTYLGIKDQINKIKRVDAERQFFVNPQYKDSFNTLSMAAGQKSSAITMAQILTQFAAIYNLAFSIPVSALLPGSANIKIS